MKLLLSILLLVACVAVGAGDEKIEARAFVLEEKGKFAEAAELYESLCRAEKKRDKKARYLEKTAECRLKSGNAKATVNLYKQLLTDFPDVVAAQLRVVGNVKTSADRARQHEAFRKPTDSPEAKAVKQRLQRIKLKKLAMDNVRMTEAINKVIELGLAADSKSKAPLDAIYLAPCGYVHEEDIAVFRKRARNGKLIQEKKHVLLLHTLHLNEEDDEFGIGDDDDEWDLGDDEEEEEDDDVDPVVSFTVNSEEGMPLQSVLRNICGMVGCSMIVRGRYIVILGPLCTDEPLSLGVYPLPKQMGTIEDPEKLLDNIGVILPYNTAGDAAFVSYSQQTRFMFLYSSEQDHRRLRKHLAAVDKVLKDQIEMCLDLIEVKGRVPAFVRPSYLSKLPAGDKRVVDRVCVSLEAGKPAVVRTGNQRKHDIQITGSIGADRETIRLSLNWQFSAGNKVESKLDSKFAFKAQAGRIIHLGMENGSSLLAVITVKLPAEEDQITLPLIKSGGTAP